MRAERRKLMMAGDLLPAGYQRLEFIQNPSTAYIDTGVDGGHFNKTYCKFMMVQIVSKWSTIWGCRHNNSVERGLHVYEGTRKFWVNHYNQDKTSNIDAAVDVLYEADYNNGIYTINGQTETFAPTAVFTNNYSCFIFALHDNNAISDNVEWKRFARMKCYSFKMWQDDTMVRDFVPCKRRSDNVCGMYDKVEGKFYTSASSVAFTGG